jgi:hypothetical protein
MKDEKNVKMVTEVLTQVKGKLLDWQVTSICLYSDMAKLNEEGSIQCQKVRCKTIWVSLYSYVQPVIVIDAVYNIEFLKL